jgi:energy-coupling factor transporter ATP-binding protein EcfA2
MTAANCLSKGGSPFFCRPPFCQPVVNHVEALRSGAQQNKIYIFDGPHGCGKSTFLNNLLKRFEEYANTDDGSRYETVWRLDRSSYRCKKVVTRPLRSWKPFQIECSKMGKKQFEKSGTWPCAESDSHILEVPCPCHDNPLLMIPKSQRRQFLDDLFENNRSNIPYLPTRPSNGFFTR